MNILVTGASGFIGTALVQHLEGQRHHVIRLVRRDAGAGQALWNPAKGAIDLAGIERLNAVVHLAGESLSRGRWTKRKKERILGSRVAGTALLAQTLAGLEQPPQVLVSASAIGYYGDRGRAELGEEAAAGRGFLAEVCQAWEAAAAPARAAGMRVVHARFGLVLGRGGGALGKMLLPFKLGLGGRLGSGHQVWSWISLHDLVRALEHLLTQEALEGPVNLVAPNPVSNRQFTKVLGQILHRPVVLPLPAVLLRLMFGEVADEMLLPSTHVVPTKLLAAGFEYAHPELAEALSQALGSG